MMGSRRRARSWSAWIAVRSGRLPGRRNSLGKDRGEFGPMAYAVMVSAMVLLAIVVAAWGENIANMFMDQVEGPAGGGDGGGGNGSGGNGG